MATVTLVMLLGAFVAGLLSFLSPCVLPLTPIYLAQLVGPAIREDRQDAACTEKPEVSAVLQPSLVRRATVVHAAAFVGGFSLAFIALGATASALGAYLAAHADLLRRVGGIVLVLLGLHVSGVVRVPVLDREARLRVAPAVRERSGGYPLSFLVGLVFGLGWTPCVGPLLAGILLLAAQAATLTAGVVLLAVYSLGLGVPFLALALAFDRLAPALRRLTPYLRWIEIGTGALLILMGIVIFFNWLIRLSSWIHLPSLGLP